MQQIVAALEVLMREQMHQSLTAVYGVNWYYTQRSELDDRTRGQISKVHKYLGKSPSPGKVVAEMDFGTWTYLLETGGFIEEGTPSARKADYDTHLWQSALVNAFPNAGTATRTDIGLLARRARWARNRMAHRESILFGFPHPGQRDATGALIRQTPISLLEDLRTLAGYLNADIGHWLRSCVAPDALLASKAAQMALTYAQTTLYSTRAWV
ncbi:hypothetical protein [Subtercola vilae]|nr:hypothetical protein [Subtercola vilae]